MDKPYIVQLLEAKGYIYLGPPFKGRCDICGKPGLKIYPYKKEYEGTTKVTLYKHCKKCVKKYLGDNEDEQ